MTHGTRSKYEQKRLILYQRRRDDGLCIQCGGPQSSTCKGLCDKHRDIQYRAQSKHHGNRKLRVMTYYCGGYPHCQCPGCGVSYLGFLQIDHVNGDGREHRKQLGTRKSVSLTSWLEENGLPSGFQVLCANCNGAKGRKEKCPMHGLSHSPLDMPT